MLTELHLKGHISSSYIDDLYLQGKNYDACVHNVIDTVIQIDTLGLITHPDKSVFNPTQQLLILGFVLNSVKDGAYYCYCAYVLRISRYSGSLSVMLTSIGIFLRVSKLSGESRS